MRDDEIDPARYPQVAAYLASLPEGLASHPECMAKASLYRHVLDESPLPDQDGLPEVLADLLAHPRPVNTWIPEVYSHSLLLSEYDRVFPDERRFAAFCYETQRKLWSTKVYAMLMRWSSPQRLLASGSQRWGVFHRGSTLDFESAGEGRATLRLAHPFGLYDRLSRVGLVQGLRAAMDMSTRYRWSLVELGASPTGASWETTWVPAG